MNISSKQKKVVVFGATGKTGIRLVMSGLKLGHRVTAFVRSEEKLAYMLGGNIPSNLEVYVGDALNVNDVRAAMKGNEAAINTAAPEEYGDLWVKMCKIIIDSAGEVLNPPKRLWLFGGAPAMDFPGTNIMCSQLPFFPSFFKIHEKNYALLKESNLDWSFMCPGPMGPTGTLNNPGKLRITTEVLPYFEKYNVRGKPKVCLSYKFVRKVGELEVSFEDIARIVMTNLDAKGPYYRKRVAGASGMPRKVSLLKMFLHRR